MYTLTPAELRARAQLDEALKDLKEALAREQHDKWQVHPGGTDCPARTATPPVVAETAVAGNGGGDRR
jgi:hypothetical protein